jgi:hypothetical protein
VSNDIRVLGSLQQAPFGRRSAGRPSQDLISGMISTTNGIVVFDYDRGARSTGGSAFPQMPEAITGSCPMALWNVAQEIHTGRIYEPILGEFYILVVPLVALMTILVLVTGYIRWRKIYMKS